MSASAYNWSLSSLLEPWAQTDSEAVAATSVEASDGRGAGMGAMPRIAQEIPAVPVNGINLDSRLVVPGDIYVALPGGATHGMNFAVQAVDSGAKAVLISAADTQPFAAQILALTQRGVAVVIFSGLEDCVSAIASRFYAQPDNDLKLIAVTGTDGKTSVCRFIAQAMSACGVPCGYIGTIGWGLGDDLQASALTTPDSISLRRMLATMRDQGAGVVALEASSHGIAEGRLDGLSLHVAVLTNLGRDHLDYHVTPEAYRAAKEQLFHWPTLRAVVLNADDVMGQELLAQITHIPGYSYSASDKVASAAIGARNVRADDAGLAFELVENNASHSVTTSLLGRFNVDNLLACYACLRACGIAANDARHSLVQVQPVAGRMERLGGGSKPTVVIDYSHTPGALRVAINAVRVHCARELWVVFGCGGDRDKGKRVPMAQVAQTADHIVVTDDNPRTEGSAQIISELMQGFDNPDEVSVIADRAEAIAFALQRAQVGDLVLIAGKGHEDYQIVGTQRLHFSDREHAQLQLESVA